VILTRLVWAGIVVGVIYWVLGTATNVISGDLSSMWARLLDACLFILFGLYAHMTIRERRRVEEELRRQAGALAALQETALDLATQRGLPDLLRAIVARAVALVRTKGGGLYLYRPATDDLELAFTHGLDPDFTGAVLRRSEGLAGKVLDSRQPQAVDDYHVWEGRAERFAQAGLPSSVAVPIFWGDLPLGILYLADDIPRTFSPDDVDLLERFAPLAAAALQNARLYSDLQEQMEQLHAAQTQLLQSARLAAVGELAAGVAHELNNPLTSILGYAELALSEASADNPCRKDVQTIASEAQRARDIVSNLLSFSRQTAPEMRPADINRVLQETLAVIRYRLEKRGVHVEEQYATGIAPLLLDERQMKQVFLNLITNAIQVMPQGGTLSVQTAHVGPGVTISIADTGVGIPTEIQERIFDPFFTTQPSATGLGLSVSLGIVQEHGGRITVDSQEGRGSTFTVWLPIRPPEEGENNG
jgi:signal transduction histidine kinase